MIYGNRVTIFRICNSQTEKFDYLCGYGTAASAAGMLRAGADDKTNMKHDGESAPLMARTLFLLMKYSTLTIFLRMNYKHRNHITVP